MLEPEQIERFVEDGFVRIDNRSAARTSARAASHLLELAGIDAGDPAAWTTPVVRVEGSSHPAVVATLDTDEVREATDQLVGAGRWERRTGYGTFPIRFPSAVDPGDAGWHIDGSFGAPPHYQVNLQSRGRALLALVLFTDVDVNDAPTRILIGSHRPVACALRAAGRDVVFSPTLHAPEVVDLPQREAVGPAGTVYLCHPFLVHAAAWPHRGTGPRVIGQPAIHHAEGAEAGAFDLTEVDPPPVVRAIREALS